jgi:hypothetical protein
MAGKRRHKGKPSRKQRQASYWRDEIATARHADNPAAAQFAVIARWFRAEVARVDPGCAAAELNAASRDLAARADRIRSGSCL